MAEPVLEVSALSKRYGALAATDEVSLDIRPGEIHALIGPNGAGKSTLIGLITGWIALDAGRIRLGGQDITELSVAARARAGLGRSFQVSSLGMDLTARQNIMLAIAGRSGRVFGFWRQVNSDARLIEAAEAVLNRVGLGDRSAVAVAELSHGERRQLELGCALALGPRVFLLDEPMAGLGAGGTAALTRLLDGLRHEAPILLVEHDMDAVFQLADRISVLVYGRVIGAGSPGEIRASAAVREAYLGDAG